MEEKENEQEKELNYLELSEKIKNLKGIEKRYYNFLPDECWMTENTQVERLNKGSITKVGRSRLQRVKRKLIEEGLLRLELLPNGKRNNPKHKLHKMFPIRLRENEELYLSFSLDEESSYYDYYVSNIDWKLLQRYTAQDLNQMDKTSLVRLYIDCGFVVLPTHYPIFFEDSVKCSCKNGIKCSNIGKHSIHRYKYIDSFNYEKMKNSYLKEFENNPDLNIGFKVMGFSVLDVDNRHGGNKSLARLLHESDVELKNVLAVKCSNGQHIYATNTNLKNTAGLIGEGLDIRSENGFVVAPGSVHKSGKVYEWNEIGEVARLPEEWFYTEEENEDSSGNKTRDRSNQAASKQLKDINLPRQLTANYRIPEGERELTLFKWACRTRGEGATAEQLYDILITIRDTYCEEGEEPVSDEEVRGIAVCASKNPTNAEKKLMALKS